MSSQAPQDVEPEQKAPSGTAASEDSPQGDSSAAPQEGSAIHPEMIMMVDSKLYPMYEGRAKAWQFLRRMKESHHGRKMAPAKNFQCVHPTGDGRICGKLINLMPNGSPAGFDIQNGTRHCIKAHNMVTSYRGKRTLEDAEGQRANARDSFGRASRKKRGGKAENGGAGPSSKRVRRRKSTARSAPASASVFSLPPYYASGFACELGAEPKKQPGMPERGMPAPYARERVANKHALDFNERLNTSSYVNVVFEPEEADVAMMGLKVNIADQNVYPRSWGIHNQCVDMIARLWNCPVNKGEMARHGSFAGAGTVGSTESCLLAGITLKKRWEAWFTRRNRGKSPISMGKRPNLVISTMYQACWEKFFRYMDIEARLVQPSIKTMKIDPYETVDRVDDCTIGVVCIMGNHYGGQYDPVEEIGLALQKLNDEKKLQVGIHVDAASGGFLAPFQEGIPNWDFRCPQVLSISASGHKFGQSCAGTGWVVWRKRDDLAAYTAINVTYLGGSTESYTLNFSRPASGVYVQYYKFLRLGKEGYTTLADNMMTVSKYIRNGLKSMLGPEGKLPRFRILDDGDSKCLPVVTAMLNPDLELEYDDIDLQHMLSMNHWYVSGYRMGFHHPEDNKISPLFRDADPNTSMFRIVVKSNLTSDLAKDLLEKIRETLGKMDKAVKEGWAPHLKEHKVRPLGHKNSHAFTTC